SEPWLLPVALYSGSLQLPIREAAMRDPVERLLLPGLQHRTFGVLSLVAGRKLWRDFQKKAGRTLNQPATWAAAVEFLMGEQTMRESTQAAVAKHYRVSRPQILPRIKQIRQTRQIKGLDERYSPLGGTKIVFKQ